MKKCLGAILMVAVLSSPAFTQGKSVPARDCDRETRCIDFTDVEVDGHRVPVSGIYQIVKKPTKFESLIRERTSFEPELQRSVDRL